MSKLCPNYQGCRLVQTDAVVSDPAKKEQYISEYCQNEDTYKNCVRYITKKALWICPDFVLPDSEISEDEIIERYEQQKQNPNIK